MYGNPRGGRQRSRGTAGFSIVEVLVAAGILLFILLGMLPMFTQSIVSNTTGNQYTQMTNAAKSELERLSDLAVDGPELSLLGGTTEKLTTTYYSESRKEWVDDTTLGPTEIPLWNRTVTIHQCDFRDFVNQRCTTRLAGGVIPPAQVREVSVTIAPGCDASANPGITLPPGCGSSLFPGISILGLNKRVSFTVLRSF